jgi:uncharacterized protein (TIGR02611 family)
MSSTPATATKDTSRRRRMGALRDHVRSWPGGRLIWRVAVTLIGGAVIAVGIVLLPLPGPGWLIIFGGLGILGSEYSWAKRLLTWARGHVRRWSQWLDSKPLWVRLLAGLLVLVVLAGLALAAWFIPR